jgi:hypothetical protein
MNVVIFLLFVFAFIAFIEYNVLLETNLHKKRLPHLYENPFYEYYTIHPTEWEHISSKRIVFAGLARNTESTIQKNIRSFQDIGHYFHDYKIILFENDSHDNTRQHIIDISKEDPNVILIDCENSCKFNEKVLYDTGALSSYRIDKMTFFRNKYLDYVQQYYSDYDYMVVFDFDSDGTISLKNLVRSLSHTNDWDCIAANGQSPVSGTLGLATIMYDSMAFCETENDLLRSKTRQDTLPILLYKQLKTIPISFQTNLYPVKSAFNGLCIYRIPSILNKRYEPGWSCEHNSLNSQLKHLYIDPQLKLYTGFQGPRGKLLTFFK